MSMICFLARKLITTECTERIELPSVAVETLGIFGPKGRFQHMYLSGDRIPTYGNISEWGWNVKSNT